MSVDSIQGNIQQSEQYVIRAKREAQSATQIQESQKAEQTAAEVDTYDKDNPAGVQAEGVYSVSHDESGNLKVDYIQPAGKSDSTEQTQSAETSRAAGKSQPVSAGAGASATSSTSTDDDELEELQRQKNEIQQQLNRESDENVKAQLRLQLQNIEAQIIQLKIN